MIHQLTKTLAIMKTIINPKATSIDLTIRVAIQLLETEGWDFDEFHDNTAEGYGLTREQAQEKNYQENEIELHVSGSATDPKVLWSWHNFEKNESTDRQDSGDDSKSIEDICTLIDGGHIKINPDKDYSVDESDKYCPAFIQLVEA